MHARNASVSAAVRKGWAAGVIYVNVRGMKFDTLVQREYCSWGARVLDENPVL